MNILVNLVFLMVIAAIVYWIWTMLPAPPEPFKNIILMLLLVILLVCVIMMAMGRLVLIHL